jgi:protein phosphatase
MSDDITAPYAPEALRPPVALEHRVRMQIGARTDIGRVRENNEDKYDFFMPDDETVLASRGAAFIVCDGMGGHEAGQIASELAGKTFLEVYYSHPAEDAAEAAEAAVRAAHRFVTDSGRAIPSRRGMGCTLSALCIVQGRALVAHVGDSRIYRLRGEELTMLTEEHTWVESMVHSGQMERAEAERHPYAHVLLQAIGGEGQVLPQVAWLDLKPGDTFLGCSDGVTNHVPDEGLRQILMSHGPSVAAHEAVKAALLDGGRDNATALVVRIAGIDPA